MASWENFFIELGLDMDINEIPLGIIQTIATDSLVTSTSVFLRQDNWSLHHDINSFPLRQGDELLMHLFLQCRPPLMDEQTLNRCRLYLQVLYVAEICSGDTARPRPTPRQRPWPQTVLDQPTLRL
jgi:hypothetical protein